LILKNNLKFLSNTVIKKIEDTKKREVEFKTSKDNNIIPIVDKVSLHSVYYPLKEGEKLNFIYQKNSICIALGLGGSYHLYDYYIKSNEIIVIAIEYDILHSILNQVDLSKYYDHRSFKIIDVSEIIDYFDFFKYDNYFLMIHPVLQNLYSKKILEITKQLKDNLNPLLLDINTQKKFGVVWQNNINKNFARLFNDWYNFEPLVIDKPILICGAGPSLDMNIEIIKENSDKFYIASSDTSLKILNCYKIEPDAVFSFDCQNYSYLHFLDFKKSYRLFTDFISPIAIEGVKQTPLFSSHPFFKIFNQLNYYPIKIDSNTRNIGGAMVDFFSQYFDKIPIVTAGIDYSYYKNESYSKGSYLSTYKLLNSDFFVSEERIDADLFYKNNFTETKYMWKTTSLLQEYSKNTKRNIYSLSDSPFVEFERIKDLSILFKKKVESLTLDFAKPSFSKDELIVHLENYIKTNYDIFLPYFLSARTYPAEENLNILLKKIKTLINLK